VALTWLLERLVPPPYSGFLAVSLVGLVATEILRRQPRQRALRMFYVYLRARERGADELAARVRLLERFCPDPARRLRVAAEVEARWVGPSERDRAIEGVTALLAHERRPADPETTGGAYDRARDRFAIPGWEALPEEFVSELRQRLDAREWSQLDTLARKYRFFQQRFFRNPTALRADPAASATDFARLLHSAGNRLAKEESGDAERAYRLSLRLRPDGNLAHAGLALLLADTGRTREAGREAEIGLAVLEVYAAAAAERRDPTPEDISPFRSPAALREALERVRAS
jgi:hypothetical protein